MTAFNRNLLWILGVLLIGTLIWYFSDIVTYILLAWVLSLLGQPMMRFFLKKIRLGKFKMGRSTAAGLTLLSFFLIVTAIILLFAPPVVKQARNLTNLDYASIEQKLSGPLFNINLQLHKIGILDPDENLASKTNEILQTWFKPTMVSDAVSAFFSVAGNLLITVMSVSFILFFFLQDNTMFEQILKSFAPHRYQGKIIHAIEDSSKMLQRYFVGLVTQVSAVTLILLVLLSIMRVENAFLIAFFGGVINLVPYVGPIMGLIFGVFITLSAHITLPMGALAPELLKVLGAFAAMQATDNFFLQPYIFSNSVKAHPLEIFITILVGAKLGGILGMVIAIPTYTVLRVVLRIFFSEFEMVQNITKER